MAEAGLSTPLHLAASLLASFAAAGLAAMVLARPGAPAGQVSRPRTDWVLAAGGFAYAAGHLLAGALVPGTEPAVPWLHALGLVLIAAGLSRSRLRQLGGPALVIPVAAPPAAVVIATVAGVVAAVRAVASGTAALPMGVGLLAWAAAAATREASPATAAVLTLIGAAAIGVWLWRVSATSLRAKLVTASVALLLAVVVLIAGALSNLGARDLVEDELDRLETLGTTVARDLEQQWLLDAVNAATILSDQGPTVLRNARANALEGVYRAFFAGQEQEFLVVLDQQGRVAGSFAPGGPPTDSFLLQIQGAPFVEQLVTGQQPRAATLLTVGGEFVAVGGVPLTSPDALPEEPPLGVVVTGRRADDAWASRAQQLLNTDLVVWTGTATTVASEGVRDIADDVAGRLRGGRTRAAMTVGGRPVYAAAAPIEDVAQGGTVGRVIALSEADALADLEQAQAQRLFLLALVGALLAGLAAAVISGRLVAPIRRLTEAAAAVREGNLEVAPAVDSTDEVGALGRTFNEMTRSLATQSAQLRDAAAIQTRLRGRLEALTSSMSDGLVAVNPDGKVVTFNPAAQRLVGRDITEVLGLPLEQVLIGHAPNDRSPTEALGAYDSEEVLAVQLLLERADGRYVPTAVTAAPVHDIAGGRVLGRVLVLRDVTREVEVERMKTEFLSNVSHELRTPLTPIKGYAEVLARRDVGPERTRRFADQILDSTSRLERIVATIVDFAALDSGRLELRPEAVDIHRLIDQMLVEWRAAYPEREFRRRLAKDLPAAHVDASMLRRCLEELVANAVKFSPDGGPISVHASEVVEDRRAFVRLSVRDRGVGIEPDLAARIFSDFYQADASETRQYGGLGLGLALVRRIMEGMGGRIHLDSRPEQGSTFHLLLPVAEPSA
ncbi:MAG TPA: ATP-binding protein [Egibacteraceae bacterium]|nr:ATP-binding protein [Egibacteraceae bacterium]